MSFKQRFIVAHADHNCFLNLLSDVDNVGCFASAKHAMGNGNGNGNVNGNGNGISLFNKKNSTLLKLETNSGLKEEGCDQYCLYYKMRHYRKYYLGEYLILLLVLQVHTYSCFYSRFATRVQSFDEWRVPKNTTTSNRNGKHE